MLFKLFLVWNMEVWAFGLQYFCLGYLGCEYLASMFGLEIFWVNSWVWNILFWRNIQMLGGTGDREKHLLVGNFGNEYRYLVLDIWFSIFVFGTSRYLMMMGKRIPGAFYAGWRFGKWCRGRKPIFHNFVPFTSEHSSQCKFHQTSKEE